MRSSRTLWSRPVLVLPDACLPEALPRTGEFSPVDFYRIRPAVAACVGSSATLNRGGSNRAVYDSSARG